MKKNILDIVEYYAGYNKNLWYYLLNDTSHDGEYKEYEDIFNLKTVRENILAHFEYHRKRHELKCLCGDKKIKENISQRLLRIFSSILTMHTPNVTYILDVNNELPNTVYRCINDVKFHTQKRDGMIKITDRVQYFPDMIELNLIIYNYMYNYNDGLSTLKTLFDNNTDKINFAKLSKYKQFNTRGDVIREIFNVVYKDKQYMNSIIYGNYIKNIKEKTTTVKNGLNETFFKNFWSCTAKHKRAAPSEQLVTESLDALVVQNGNKKYNKLDRLIYECALNISKILYIVIFILLSKQHYKDRFE